MNKKNEWNDRALSLADYKKQICRPLSEGQWQEIFLDIKSKLVIDENARSILDIGCGNALILSFLAEYFSNINGIDYAEAMIKKAKILLPEGNFITGEAANLDYADKSFDHVLSYSIFHYFPNEKYVFRVIDEILRVTKPGGIILIGDILDAKYESNIKAVSNKDIENKLPYILRYSEWMFCNLKELEDYIKPKAKKVEILSQPSSFKLGYYRKDLRVWV